MTNCDLISVINRFCRSKPALRVGEYKLNGFEMAVLLTLRKLAEEGEQKVKVSKLCEIVGMKKSAFSKALSDAQDKDFVVRNTSEKDRREVYVSLSKEGVRVSELTHQKMDERYQAFVSRMGDEEMSQFFDLLNKAVDIWEELND